RRRHTRFSRDWSSDVCSSDLAEEADARLTLIALVQRPDRQVRVLPADLPPQRLLRGGVLLPEAGKGQVAFGQFVASDGLRDRPQIGRAACRERVEIAVDDVSV